MSEAAHSGAAAGGVVMSDNGTRWQNRIVGEDMVQADQLLANPHNWRIHPRHQQQALTAALDGIGWIQRVIVNQRTGHVIDGHLRAALAISRDEQVPVLYVDLSEDEEKLALASLDPLSAMAATDRDMLSDMLAELRATELVQDDAALDALLRQIENNTHIVSNGDLDGTPIDLDSQFMILIECDSELEQLDLLRRFSDEGLKCRALIS